MTMVDGKNEKISIRSIIANFTGNSYETVDFKNDIYKKIYSGIQGKI